MKKFIQCLDENAKKQFQSETDCITMIHQINNNYHFHNIGPKEIFLPGIINNNSAYANWQKHHEAFIIPTDEPIKEKKYIEAKIETIDDIIHIIKNNPYDNNYDYNIDLKLLHSIHEELIQINNMIGLHNLKKSIVDQLLYFIQIDSIVSGVNALLYE
jgi:hypothetical protein